MGGLELDEELPAGRVGDNVGLRGGEVQGGDGGGQFLGGLSGILAAVLYPVFIGWPGWAEAVAALLDRPDETAAREAAKATRHALIEEVRALHAKAGERVVDFCAGAGGKTLGLAAAMDNRGRLIACDVDRPRLSKLEPRAVRAGVTIAETRLLDPNREAAALADLMGQADAVLVDAPCSGTGTWRRNPEARWRLTPDQLARYVAIQSRLLDLAAQLVRPGGRLGFVTCSLLDAEGANQAEGFLARHSGWAAEALALGAGEARGPGVRLSPARDGTDGFFVACFQKR